MDDALLGSPTLTALLSQVVLAIIGIIAAAVARPIFTLLRTRLTQEQFAYLQDIVLHAVRAVEQYGLNGEVEDKKTAAYDIIRAQLSRLGVSVSDADIDAAIEAAVLEEFNYSRVNAESEVPIVITDAGDEGDGDAPLDEPATDTQV